MPAMPRVSITATLTWSELGRTGSPMVVASRTPGGRQKARISVADGDGGGRWAAPTMTTQRIGMRTVVRRETCWCGGLE
jgi:hypothetical protein